MALVPAFDAVQDQDQVLSVQNKEIPRHIQDSLIRGTTAHITPSNYFPSASRAMDYGSWTLQLLGEVFVTDSAGCCRAPCIPPYSNYPPFPPPSFTWEFVAPTSICTLRDNTRC